MIGSNNDFSGWGNQIDGMDTDNSGSYSSLYLNYRGGKKIILTNSSDGNVGIGTTNPSYKLEVNSVDSALNVSGNLYVNSSNVGIGFDNPQHTLHIENSSGDLVSAVKVTDGRNSVFLQASRSVGDGGVIGTRLVLDDNGASGKRWDITTGIKEGGLVFRNNDDGINALTLNSSGDVGIGTTSPDRNLEVSGTGAQQIEVESTSTDADLIIDANTDSDARIILQEAGVNLGWIRLDGDDGNKIKFQYSTSATDAMTIDQTGKIGIGTAFPGAKLHVSETNNSAFDAAVAITRTASGGDSLAFLNIGSNWYFGRDSAGNAFQARYANWDLTEDRWESTYTGSIVGPVFTQYEYNGDINFKSMAPQSLTEGDALSFVNVMTLKGGGNVGIVTTNPQARLEVDDNNYWYSTKYPAVGIKSIRPALAFYDDNSEGKNVTVLYQDQQTFKIAKTAFTTNDWGYDEKIDALKIDSDASITFPYVYSDIVGGTNRDLYIDNTGLIGYVSSSIRYKENIKDIGNGSEKLYDLRPVSFNYKGDNSSSLQYGLIAEEVEEVMPEIVSYDEEGNPETVSYSKLISPMLNEIQQLKEENEELKKRIEVLEKKI